MCALVRISIAVRRHHDYSNCYKWKHLTGAASRGLIHCHHGGKHDGMKGGMCWRVAVSLTSQSAGSSQRVWAMWVWLELLKPQIPLPWIISFNKSTPTSTRSQALILSNKTTPNEPMGVIFIQPTTPWHQPIASVTSTTICSRPYQSGTYILKVTVTQFDWGPNPYKGIHEWHSMCLRRPE